MAQKSLLGNTGDTREDGLIPELGRSPGIGNGNPFQYSCLENPTDRGATVYRVAKSGHNWTDLAHSTHIKPTSRLMNLTFKVYLIRAFFKRGNWSDVENVWVLLWCFQQESMLTSKAVWDNGGHSDLDFWLP